MSVTIGLDFGTTNSALALLEGGKARVINANNRESSERTLRSVVFIDEDQTVFVGQQAIDQYIQCEGMFGRFLQSLKAFLPNQTFTETRIFSKRFEIEDLVALILSEIKACGERHAGCEINRVVLGRPVLFSDKPECDALAQTRLLIAAQRAGFKEIHFEYEPVAATLAYRSQLPSDTEQVVLMGDFGGGTSDFTVMRLRGSTSLSEEEKRQSVLSVGGVYVGGDTFDGRIMWEKVTPYLGRDIQFRDLRGQWLPMPTHLMQAVCQWHRIPFLRDRSTLQSIRSIKRTADNPRLVDNLENLILENKGFLIFQAIERAKKELSSEIEAQVDYHDRGLTISESISRSEFEAAVENDIAAIAACVNKVIADAGINVQDIDKVLLTGGSSFVLAIRRLFEVIFGPDKIIHLDAFTSVAHGLALSASVR